MSKHTRHRTSLTFLEYGYGIFHGVGALAVALSPNLLHAELPVPCVAGACSGVTGPIGWLGSGTASAALSGNTLTITQGSERAVLNWKSFNLGAADSVEFRQPSASAVAINKIFQADPSRILGRMTANGQIYLINQNGILFGKGAQVNVGGLIASSLNMASEAAEKGLVRILPEDRKAAFTAATDLQGRSISGDVLVEQGASLTAASGGQIMLFAPNVTNRGTITTPSGQAVLAAGSKVYLALDTRNPDLRGLVVEVDVDGVSDAALLDFVEGRTAQLALGRAQNFGTMTAAAGNVSLVGLAVNQAGRVSATTTVRANGTIYLKAADKLDVAGLASGVLTPTRGGKVTLAEGSLTEAVPDLLDTQATVDVNAQPQSKVEISGHTAQLLAGSTVRANSGTVTITAQGNPSNSDATIAVIAGNRSRVLVEAGARIDVSGTDVTLDADRLTGTVQLFSDQLKNSPQQRDGVLRGQEVTVDLRRTGVFEDGRTWVGTPLADVSGVLDTINRTVAERSVTGGKINLNSQGDVLVSAGSTLDVSGGTVTYNAGSVPTTKLLSQGKVYDIGDADPGRSYDGVVGALSLKSMKWGTSQSWSLPETYSYTPGYQEGRSAGSLTLNSSRMILDGTVLGGVYRGPTQRDPLLAPRNGELIVGYLPGAALQPFNYRVGNLLITEQLLLAGLRATGFNPQSDALPSGTESVVIRPSLFGEQGIGNAVLLANGSVTLSESSTVALPAGGSIELRGDSVLLNGDISAPGGRISAAAQRTQGSIGAASKDVRVGAGATLDVSGLWANDLPQVSPGGTEPLNIDGGIISLQSANGSVDLLPGSRLDASGSAWVRLDGSIKAGKGGAITLGAADAATRSGVRLGGELQATGLQSGGTLSVTTDAVCVSDRLCGMSPTQYDVLNLAPGFFTQGGFRSYSIQAKRGDLVVASGAVVSPRQFNRILDAGFRGQQSGLDIERFSHTEFLPQYQRQASTISLGTTGPGAAQLIVEQGAVIQTDPRGSIGLGSRTRLLVDGALVAHGGNINLTLQNLGGVQNFNPGELLWLGSQATLDASGATLLKPDLLGRPVGDVLAGGRVSLRADHGYVVAAPGSLLDVSGVAAELYLAGADSVPAPTLVASHAGGIDIAVAEAAVLNGTMLGKPGDSTALGGTFNLTVDGNTRGEPSSEQIADSANRYLHTSRTIEILSSSPGNQIGGTTYQTVGLDFASRIGSTTQVDGSALPVNGFDAASFTVRHLLTNDPLAAPADLVRSPGVLRLGGSLQLGRSLNVDAPLIDVGATNALLAAPYVSIGSRYATTQYVPDLSTMPAPFAGFRNLTVRGGFLDVLGASGITGAAQVRLESDADIRLRAAPTLESTVRSLEGSLSTVGLLTLQADQIYPASMTRFTLAAMDGTAPGSVRILPGGAYTTPLSAGGQLNIFASRIEQGGVLSAPFGQIRLEATGLGAGRGELLLTPASVTSTSAAGQLIPLGRTEGGLDWVYDLGNTQKLVFGATLDKLPQQAIDLSANKVDMAAGSVLDVSGGGDLQAYEFIPGVGGTVDLLANSAQPRSYAVLPGQSQVAAAFDHQNSAGFAPVAGTTVQLTAAAGALPAGEYVLLPPSYALLPGAFLITERSGYQDLPDGTTSQLRDGTVVASGRFAVAGTNQQDSRTRGFSVTSSAVLRDASNARRPAEYTLTLASKFFAAQDTAAVSAAQRLPQDAGSIVIEAGESLLLKSKLRGSPATGGRGAAVDIAARELVVAAGSGSAASPATGSVLAADVLNSLGAESILLGGIRSVGAAATGIETSSSRVTLQQGAVLKAPELLLVAREQLALESGAAIYGQGSTAAGGTDLTLVGDGALLRVSSGKQVDVLRSGVTGQGGALAVATGAVVQADGAAFIDVSGPVGFSGQIALNDADLAISAAKINIGAVPTGTLGFNLDQGRLTALSAGADNLLLRSRSDINFYDGPQLTARSLTLDTGALVARSGTANTTARVTADHLGLLNTTGTLHPGVVPQQNFGQLRLQAPITELGSGTYRISGFDSVQLLAQDAVIGTGEGQLRVDAARLAIQTGVMGGQDGASTTITAAGEVGITSSGRSATAPDSLAAGLRIEGDSVAVGTRLVARAGNIDLIARGAGGLSIGPQALLDVSGAARSLGGESVYAGAGDIRLEAKTGNVSVSAGAELTVQAVAGGDAGRLQILATQGVADVRGTLRGAATASTTAGSSLIDARQVVAVDGLNAALNAGGFTDERVLRIRQGDVRLNTGIVARRVDITADGEGGVGGALDINTRLDVSGAQGGQIRLAARGPVSLQQGASLDLQATDAAGTGGDLEMLSSEAGVRVLAGSAVRTSGGAEGRDGTVSIRVNRNVLGQLATGSAANPVVLDGTIAGAREIVLEGTQTYRDADGRITADEVEAYTATAFGDADQFMSGQSSITAALGQTANAKFHLRPGVEVWSPGDLTLASEWDLTSWRFAGEPGVLTLRAGGNLRIDRSLSDGYSPDLGAFLDQPAAASWRFRLTAGADLQGASPYATTLAGGSAGSLLLAAGTQVDQRRIRTGSSDIEINAAGNVVLGNSDSVIYTMGTPVQDLAPSLRGFLTYESLQAATLAENGGDITVRAGGNIQSVPAQQLVTDWLWRLGSLSGDGYPTPTVWGTEFSRFRSGIGALAGGNVTLAAGGNIDNVSASVASVGVPLGIDQYDNRLDVRGGGALRLTAGQDIGGGVYFVGQGTADIRAGGSIRAGTGATVEGGLVHTVLAMGDASMRLAAQGDITLETVFNPTLFSPSAYQSPLVPLEWLTDFVTYGRDSGVSAQSLAGSVRITGNFQNLLTATTGSYMFDSDRQLPETLSILPPRLRLAALSGDVNLGTGATRATLFRMLPSEMAQFQLLASGTVNFLNTAVLISDANPAALPSPLHPQRPSLDFNVPTTLSLLSSFGPFTHAPVPVHSAAYASSVGYAGARGTALIAAGSGDIDMSTWESSGVPALQSAMPVRLVAGRDILDASIVAQNTEQEDISSLSAVRDVLYTTARDANRRLIPRNPSVNLDGPGDLVVTAGRNINLKASPGISTRGNTLNQALSADGADITVLAGVSSGVARDAFIKSYLEDRDTYRGKLADYLADRGAPVGLSNQLATLRALSAEEQAPLLAEILFAEIRTLGRKAVTEGTGDFDAAYAAIKTLFPNVDPATQQTGDLALYFSRIYTLDGGDINALVPGGVVNVGLSTVPTTFGIKKSPSQLGLVAQRTGDLNILAGRDTLVNQSRVFVADGGSIMIWSSAGNIDAGRGAKTSISAPAPVITYDENGNATVQFPAALSGSGIRAFVTTEGRKPGDVDLFAPTGIVLVNDAGIGSAGNITIGATQVVGAGNIDVGGVAVGVPVDTGGLGANLASVSSTSSSASNAVGGGEGPTQDQRAPLAESALSWLDVFVVGLGEDNCRSDDADCLRRQKTAP